MYERVKRLCEEKGISLHQLEMSCGLANGLIAKWKNMETSPKLMTVMIIADYFEISLDKLVYGRDRYAAKGK